MMEYLTTSNIIFFFLAAVILVCGFLSVTTTKILRAATYLFFVLFAIAGIYLLLNYQFLAAVQLSVYAGGIVVLFVFAILLVQRIGENTEQISFSKKLLSALATITGVALCFALIYGYGFNTEVAADEMAASLDMQKIGLTLMGTDKYQYLLPFEAAGILLLSCIIGSIIIAQQKKKEDKK